MDLKEIFQVITIIISIVGFSLTIKTINTNRLKDIIDINCYELLKIYHELVDISFSLDAINVINEDKIKNKKELRSVLEMSFFEKINTLEFSWRKNYILVMNSPLINDDFKSFLRKEDLFVKEMIKFSKSFRSIDLTEYHTFCKNKKECERSCTEFFEKVENIRTNYFYF